VTVELRDGSRVDVRPVEPDDRAALAAGFERLSPESRYRRFFGPMPELSERFLDYLTRVDHHDHEALVAIDPETGDGVGVARYVRTKPDAAEPAVAVIDDWQGRGVAPVLLERLVDRARDEGIERFEAPVLASNREAIAVLERLGRTTVRPDGREVQMTIDLPKPGVSLPWRSVLREFAAGTVEPARTLLERIWPRRPGRPDDERRNIIVVGTDGSEHAARAVATAASLAAGSGASVEVVGAHRFLPPDQTGVTAAVHEAAGDLRDRGLHVHENVRRGDPALVLTDLAAEQSARLIVVGAGDRGKTARRLLGSVADFVAERSPCDVLIVRPREAGGAGA
jgi:nucleotide-binding universal stress UspA family protein/RimJ/RimL family protein N-acetyltransferase